jgi:hypothetical protein
VVNVLAFCLLLLLAVSWWLTYIIGIAVASL